MTMSEARAAFAKVLTRAERGDPVQVTRGGKPVAVIVSLDQYREAEAEAGSPSRAFRAFMATLDRRALRGSDPWKGARDRSRGRDFRW
jgi:prevent-host-death family protein